MYKLLMLMSLVPLAAMANPTEQSVNQCDAKKHHEMKHQRAGDMPFYLRGIDLDEAQQAQVKALMEKRVQDRLTNKTAFHENKKAIYELTRAETLDEAALEKLVDEDLVLKKQSEMAQARFHHQVFNLLTEDQQTQLETKLAEFKKKHHH